MIVTVVSMPEVSVTRTDAAEARHRLATDPFVLVDVELPVEDQEGERSVADQLGLDTESLDWFGRADEPPRAEYLGDRSYFVVPVVHEERIAHIHVVVTERFMATVHRGQADLERTLREDD
ncbi:hypothetical protein [Streptomyces sp. NPDC002520]